MIQASDQDNKTKMSGLVWCLIALAGLGILATLAIAYSFIRPAVTAARTAAHVSESSKNLRQIGLAFDQYSDRHISFPPAGSDDKKLGLGLSWRVKILPFIEQQALYEKFDLKTPWDSPQNQALIEQMPQTFMAPGVELPQGKTVYLAVVGALRGESKDWKTRHTAFNRGHKPTRLSDFSDGWVNAILVVEADASEAVTWTQPADWDFDPAAPRHGLGSLRSGGFTALFGGGNVGFVPTTVSDETVRRLFTISDGQPLEDYVPPYFKNGSGAKSGGKKR